MRCMDEEAKRFPKRFYYIVFDIDEAQKERYSRSRRERDVHCNQFNDGAGRGDTM